MKALSRIRLALELCFGLALSLQLLTQLLHPEGLFPAAAEASDELVLQLGLVALLSALALAWWASGRWSLEPAPGASRSPFHPGSGEPALIDPLPSPIQRTPAVRPAPHR